MELPLVTLEALERLHVDFGIPPATMSVNNRQLSEGFYRGLGVEDHLAVLQRVDKLDKIGPDAVADLLVEEVRLTRAAAGKCLALAGIRTGDASFVDQVTALGIEHPLLTAGLELLADVVTAAAALVPGRLVADLKIASKRVSSASTATSTQVGTGRDAVRTPLPTSGTRIRLTPMLSSFTRVGLKILISVPESVLACRS